MSILDYFDGNKITVSYIPITFTIDDDGQTVETPGTPIPLIGLFWSRSEAARYFGQQLNVDSTNYFVPDNPTSFFNTDGTMDDTGKISYDGYEYEIETVDDVAEQGEVVLVGLKVHK